MTKSTNDATETTRRAWLRRGLTLAVAAPAALSLLATRPAWANDDDHDDDDDDDHDEHKNNGQRHGGDDSDEIEERLRAIGLIFRYSSRLCRVSQASGFTAVSPGTDQLSLGVVRLLGRGGNPDDDRIGVALRGAPANVSYNVVFVPSNGDPRADLGAVGPTNGNGFLNAATPNPLPGANRVGVFVLTRGGQDQFVTCVGD